MDLPIAELIKLAKIAGVMHEADHAYSIRSISYRCTIDSLCYYFALYSYLLLGSVEFYFRFWIAVF